jgi:hypothetical protein
MYLYSLFYKNNFPREDKVTIVKRDEGRGERQLGEGKIRGKQQKLEIVPFSQLVTTS